MPKSIVFIYIIATWNNWAIIFIISAFVRRIILAFTLTRKNTSRSNLPLLVRTYKISIICSI